MSLILAAIIFQAPYKPELPKLPESTIVVERFMLKGDELEIADPDRQELKEVYF